MNDNAKVFSLIEMREMIIDTSDYQMMEEVGEFTGTLEMKAQDKENLPTSETITVFTPEEIKIFKDEAFSTFSNGKRKYQQAAAYILMLNTGLRTGDDDDKIRLNQRKPSKYKGLSRFGPEKNLQRINKFMKERPTFYKKLIQMKENFRFYLRCFYCITKVVILQFNSEKQDRISS